MLSPAFAEIKRLRTAGDHAAALALIQSSPPASDADALEVVVSLYCAGNTDSALRCTRAWPWREDWTRRTSAALAALIEGREPQAALADAAAAANDPAAGPAAAAVHLLLLKSASRVPEAMAFMQARLRQPPADESFLLIAMAELALAAGDLEQAYRRAMAVLAANPFEFRALMAASGAHLEAGNPHEALGNALRASRVKPASADAALQCLRCHNEIGDYTAALAAYAALGPAPDTPATPALLTELGRAHAGLGDRAGAIAAYERALACTPPPVAALQPLLKLHAADDGADARAALQRLGHRFAALIDGDIECQFALAIDCLRARDLDGAHARLARCFALAREQGGLFDMVTWPVPEPLLLHEIGQLELLERRGKLPAAGREALALLKTCHAQPANAQGEYAPAGAQGQALREALATVYYRPDPPFTGRALGAHDAAALEAKYFAQRPSLLVIDDFLSPDGLTALREYCEEATIWKGYNDGGYTGAFLGQGFSPRVLLAIGDELRQAFPRVIGAHPLMQAWAFKYDPRHRGTTVHADFALVNVNFWITPQAACADPATGGLIVYDVPAPPHWTFADYNTNPAKMEAFLKLHQAKPRRIPYRENRCVLFDSRLFHVTDEIHFKPGYENRRVNVTFLFGAGPGS